MAVTQLSAFPADVVKYDGIAQTPIGNAIPKSIQILFVLLFVPMFLQF